MYDNDFTHRDALDDIEELLAIRQHSPRFWDADASELATVDPYEHPSVEVADALEGGWDDPAVAVEVRELLAEEVRLTPLGQTPTVRPLVHTIDDVLADRFPAPEEELRSHVLALVPVDGAGLWPAADYAERGAAA
ncbi:hypothetical protein ACWGKS_27130 [Nocardiopsis sp. NPDC055879]